MKTKLKILHLEDTPADAELVERELKKGNIQFEKLVVDNKIAFEKALKEFAPDIIISDHTLPSFDSTEAIKIIKRQGIKIPFILVSATVSDEFAVEVMKAGADDYILKDRLHRLPQAVLNAMEKKSAEQQLHESEAFNMGVISSLSSHIAVIDKSGNIIAVNKAWDNFAKTNGVDSLQGVSTGSNYIEVCQRSIASGDIIAGQTLQGIKSVFNKEVKTFELEYPCHSLTEQRWFNLSVTKFGEDDSKVVVSHQNITQRKIAEQKLQTSESRLKEAQTVAKVGSWEIDLQTLSVIWSEEHHHIFETDPKTFHVTQEAFYDFIHPEDRDIVKTTFENSFESQTLNSIEHRIIATNGGLKHVCERWKIFRDAQGHPVRAVGTCQDITERKIAENKLNATSNELETAVADLNKILDSSLDVICTINAKGEFIKVSAASQQVWGYTPEELIGSKFMNLVYDEDADITSKATEKVVSGIQIPIFENRYVHKSGRIVSIFWSVKWDEKLQLMFCIAKDVTEKKRLEKAVENERDQFFDMFLKAPSAIGMLKGADHIFEMANPLYLELIGKKDIIGKTVAEVLPEVVEQGFVGMLDHVYQTGESYIGKEMLVKVNKEGNGEMTDFYIDFIYQAHRNGEGNIEGTFFFINDTTEQILSRKAIEKSEKKYRQIVETAQEGIWMVDENSRTTFVNKKMCEILEYTEEEMMGKVHFSFMNKDDKENALVSLERRKKGIAENYEISLISKNGKQVLTNISANPIFDDMGNFKGSLGMISDITEKKKADEENRFKANLLKTIGQAAIATDLNGIVNYWNRAAEHIYGWTKEEALGKHIMDLTTSEATNDQAIQIMEKLKKGQTWSGEFKVRKKDGTIFPALVANSPIHDENNILSGIIGISSDITEIKKLEDLLEKTNRLARIGSWEIDVVKGTVYWSDITKEIREVDKDYVPILGEGISYFKGIHKEIISQKVQECIENGTPWDEALEMITFKGNHKWVRTIGEGEFLNGKCLRIYGSFQDITERKKAEKEIRDSEEKRRLIMSGALDAIICIDTNDIITFWNPQAEVVFGWKEAEVMGQQLSELIIPESFRRYHTEGIKHYLKTGEGKAINTLLELEAIRKNGELFPIELTVIPINQGEEVFFCAFIRDITERKFAEFKLSDALVKLKAERIRLVTAQSVAKLGNWETDLQTWQVNWSEEMHRLYGTDPQNFEPSYLSIQSFVHPEDRKMIDKAFMDSLHKSGSSSLEHRIITLQGIEKWVEENWSVSSDEKGSPMFAVGTCQDITESKKAADKVIRSEAKLKVAQHIAQVGSYEVDMLTKEQSWSDEFYTILGINVDVIPSREAFVSFIHPEDRAMAVSTMENALSIYTDSSFQFRFIRKNGETGYASSEWRFEFDHHRNPLYIHGILRDLTKEKKVERDRVKMSADLIQRNSDLEQFSYIVSHNLRAPAANIIGFAEILQDETITPQEQKEFLQGLSASVTGLDTIIKDINTILQVKSEVHEKKEMVIFSNLVNDIMLSIGNLIYKHHVIIKRDFSEVDEIYSLKVYIYSIFYNLISNSIKYSKPNEPPHIEIKSKEENGKIILTFKDNGLGIDMKAKGDKIFGLYNRFHSHVEGKGMGLFMVKTQVESLGGKITIASELNKGTEFTIEFEI